MLAGRVFCSGRRAAAVSGQPELGGREVPCVPRQPVGRAACAGRSLRRSSARLRQEVRAPCRGGAVARLERSAGQRGESCSPPPCGGGPRSRCAGRAGCPASPDSGRTAAWAAWWSSNAVTCRLQLYCSFNCCVTSNSRRVESDGAGSTEPEPELEPEPEPEPELLSSVGSGSVRGLSLDPGKPADADDSDAAQCCSGTRANGSGAKVSQPPNPLLPQRAAA